MHHVAKISKDEHDRLVSIKGVLRAPMPSNDCDCDLDSIGFRYLQPLSPSLDLRTQPVSELAVPHQIEVLGMITKATNLMAANPFAVIR